MFIVFEGIDGAGKTTQVERVAAALRARGQTVAVFREPSDTPYGWRLRASWQHERLAPEVEFDLLFQDRSIDVATRIIPAQRTHDVVLLDRYYYSHVYQAALGMDLRAMLATNQGHFPLPDLALILDLPLERIAARMAQRGARSVLDADLDLLARVRNLYQLIAATRREARLIDADQPPEAITAAILTAIDTLRD